MQATAITTREGVVTIRPLRSGDTATVEAVFDRLGEGSRRLRFGRPKATLAPDELELLARVDGRRHVLVAYAGQEPVGIAHLVRDDDPESAEIAYAVGDGWQRLGVGTALARILAADAAAAGVLRLRATMHLENRASLSLMRRATTIVRSWIEDGQLHVIGAPAADRP